MSRSKPDKECNAIVSVIPERDKSWGRWAQDRLHGLGFRGCLSSKTVMKIAVLLKVIFIPAI